ncbi:MAG: polysaccharide pyruvyl transferase family protein [candidate division WOR-3 bacterium]|nr:polysaccharide pyruvyl transferase family protein [candidate division WOR-3 bacterium]
MAITIAQARFLSDHLPEHEIVYFPCAATYVQLKSLKHVCRPDDLITIVGGGNMGDLYASLEDARRFIVENFPDNRVISFPQTVGFSDTREGRRELRRSCRAYSRHRDLHLFAREPVSLERMREYFPNTPVHLVPDIVLYLDESRPRVQRQGILLCIRDDSESASPSRLRDDLVNGLATRGADVRVTDTHTRDNDRLPIEDRQRQLQELFDAFRKTQIVVTDRLHGMIFSAITGTPCVAFRNRNHKIKSTYDSWLRAHEYIRFQDDFDIGHTLQLVEALGQLGTTEIQPPNLTEYYGPLRKAVVGQA